LSKHSPERENHVLKFALIVDGGEGLIVEDTRMAFGQIAKKPLDGF